LFAAIRLTYLGGVRLRCATGPRFLGRLLQFRPGDPRRPLMQRSSLVAPPAS